MNNPCFQMCPVQTNKPDGLTEFADGRQEWFLDGLLHREDGPAMIYPDGTKHYYQYGRLHREDGPAIERADGSSEWFLYGIDRVTVVVVKMLQEGVGGRWNRQAPTILELRVGDRLERLDISVDDGVVWVMYATAVYATAVRHKFELSDPNIVDKLKRELHQRSLERLRQPFIKSRYRC